MNPFQKLTSGQFPEKTGTGKRRILAVPVPAFSEVDCPVKVLERFLRKNRDRESDFSDCLYLLFLKPSETFLSRERLLKRNSSRAARKAEKNGKMRPKYHAIATAAAAVPVYALTGSPALTAAFAAPCLLIDVDHLLDFVLWEKRPLDPRRFLKEGVPRTWPRLVYILHGYEWIALLALISWQTRSPFVTALAAGWLAHVLIDDLGNRLPSNPTWLNPLFYFITFRMSVGFRRERISRVKGA
jgi:hypothetical protein